MEALALLRQAGRMDLVKEEALVPGRPVCRASARVAAAVAERSRELRASRYLARRSPLVMRGVSRCGGVTKAAAEVLLRRSAGRVKGTRVAVGRARADPSGQAEQGEGFGAQDPAGSGTEAVGGSQASQSGGGEGSQLEAAGIGEQRDPKVPVSKRWPTMLVWSSSDEEGLTGEGEDKWSDGEGALTEGTLRASRRVYGSLQVGTLLEEDGSSGEGEDIGMKKGRVRDKKRVFLYPSTPDLVWQGPLDFNEEDPGEQEAALIPWEEGKASPGAASRMASSGWRGRRRKAADASSGRCGGVGDVPPDAAAWEEQCLGPSTRWSENAGEYTGCAWCGGPGEHGVERGSFREEKMSDVSLEEGELRTSGSEAEWWERQGQGRGASNRVRKSLQVTHAALRPRGRSQERVRGEERKKRHNILKECEYLLFVEILAMEYEKDCLFPVAYYIVFESEVTCFTP
ncbi:hypothetical protein NDU88_002320 [Pleurodeles waltl]|uniref:Uncharacterized protein n=1 Tax=Pleurodeles waltl TaxID=8319 RepID=A0AAV7LDV4_PLEWA|nr:hypothetical protein NDU88_002320 [Pleurodeles waltl]